MRIVRIALVVIVGILLTLALIEWSPHYIWSNLLIGVTVTIMLGVTFWFDEPVSQDRRFSNGLTHSKVVVAAEQFITLHKDIAANPRNRCIDASKAFLEFLGIDKKHVYMEHGIINGEEHHWVCFYDEASTDQFNIDFTAHQYVPSAQVPLTWWGHLHPFCR